MRSHGGWWKWLLGGVLLAWSLIAAVSALAAARSQGPDPMAALEAEFLELALDLPPHGQIGYLEQHDGVTEDAVRMYYAAQYALVPRIVVSRVGPEFLIVARGTARPGGDPRLDGFYPAATFPSGHRLYRRLVP